ncbi:hypothetical protein GH808_03755 [Acetobacterium fimetarium]|uniref:AAA domain (Dynein-related subfamily) n=1 Tax=Acetobacterium fimetarium TaxID=52691 RepID=A0ABR6WTK1_9FIRM|nr:hypothetical protein [Acetobacterium fimetarium]MBC3803551.1 hypothetical protein [Acetobacterium fimetarium]
MAKKKNNPNVSTKKDNIEKLKERMKAAKVKSAEVQWQDLLSTMSEDEAKLFVSQLDIIAKENELAERERTVKEIQEGFTGIENELDRRDDEQNEIQVGLDDRESAVQSRESAVSGREGEADKRDTDLMNRERDIISRETNAENEFATQNRAALDALRKRKEELNKEIAELEQKKIAREDDIDSQIETLRAARMSTLDEEIARFDKERRVAAQAEADQIVATAKEVVKTQKASIDAEMKALNEKASKLDSQKLEQEKTATELATREMNLQFGEDELKTEKEGIQDQITAEVDRRSGAIQFELTRLKKDKEHLKKRLDECEKRLEAYQDQEREADGMTMSELLEKLSFANGEIERLESELNARPDEVLHAEYKIKAEKYDELDTKYIRLLEEHSDLERQQMQWMLTTSQLETVREKCLIAEKRREALQASIEKYEQEVNRFRSLYEQPKELSGRLESIEAPYFKKRDMATISMSETEWLDKICKNCEEAGIKFNQRLLYSFHTALKTADWSPVTVLAGVSGTGKSLLPEYYCRFGGIYFMSMAVQPDWDSPQSLFGYFNSVDNRFNPTNLLKAMVQFSEMGSIKHLAEKYAADPAIVTSLSNHMSKLEGGKLTDSLYIVLLDEMNLAHVELYFSDMLSKLERRRNSDDEIDVEIDLGAGMPKYPLELNDNIMWVGTMNEDETTKSLSDKVLDRGNLLSFPRPKEFISRTKTTTIEAASMLPKSTWQSWLDDNVIEEERFTSRIEKYKKGLETVNEAMEFAGRALGHRVWQSIESYTANHPKVIAAIKVDDGNFDAVVCDIAMQEAFEEALVHKVMPKLRGIETDGETKIQCIDKIENVLFGPNGNDGLAPGLQADFEHAIKNAYETFIWSSAKYLEVEE